MRLFVYFVSLQGFGFQYLTLHGHFAFHLFSASGELCLLTQWVSHASKRVLDSYVFCHSVISTRARTFAAGICDFVTFFISTNVSGN